MDVLFLDDVSIRDYFFFTFYDFDNLEYLDYRLIYDSFYNI